MWGGRGYRTEKEAGELEGNRETRLEGMRGKKEKVRRPKAAENESWSKEDVRAEVGGYTELWALRGDRNGQLGEAKREVKRVEKEGELEDKEGVEMWPLGEWREEEEEDEGWNVGEMDSEGGVVWRFIKKEIFVPLSYVLPHKGGTVEFTLHKYTNICYIRYI